jgi:hypothetical protein
MEKISIGLGRSREAKSEILARLGRALGFPTCKLLPKSRVNVTSASDLI